MLTIDLDSPVPLAEQVRVGIRHAIAGGEVRPGDSLPAVRQLAGDLGINFNTVARAYRELEQEGLVVSRRGRGTVVAASESSGGASVEREARIAESIRRLLADARLAGMGEATVMQMFEREMKNLWPKESEG
jgi:DNA-binding transcriptional regulator YhcF (GntR family)